MKFAMLPVALMCMTTIPAMAATELPAFNCNSKIFYADAQETGIPTLVEPLTQQAMPGTISNRIGSLKFSVTGMYAKPDNTPEVLMSISVYEDAEQTNLIFKSYVFSSDLFAKGKADLVAQWKNETLNISCKLAN